MKANTGPNKEVTRAEAEKYLREDDDQVLRAMLKAHSGNPTRNDYIFANWHPTPEEWTAEHELGLPRIFQHGGAH